MKGPGVIGFRSEKVNLHVAKWTPGKILEMKKVKKLIE
jgi:hypothetical protein